MMSDSSIASLQTLKAEVAALTDQHLKKSHGQRPQSRDTDSLDLPNIG